MLKAATEQLRAEYEEKRKIDFAFSEQWYADLSQIAAAEVFSASPDDLKRFVDALSALRAEFVSIWNADSDDCEYTLVKADGRLREVCGPYFIPHEERYGGNGRPRT